MSDQQNDLTETLCDDDALTIKYMPGTSAEAVVAFTGVGHQMGAMQKLEFVGTSASGGANHVFFVIDKKRSWFSGEGLAERIVQTLKQAMQDCGITDVTTLGNSMGGYGALLFAGQLGAKAAVAFVPQFTMDLSVINERRWGQFRENMVDDNLPLVTDHLREGTRHYVIFGKGSWRDVPHANGFAGHPLVETWMIDGVDHRLSVFLKEKGVLTDAIMAMKDGRSDDLETLLSPLGRKMTEPTADGMKAPHPRQFAN